MMTASTRERYPVPVQFLQEDTLAFYDTEIDSSDYDQKRSSLTRMLTEYSRTYSLHTHFYSVLVPY